MPTERLPMRKIRDVLRLHSVGLSTRQIAASLSIGRRSAGDYLRRARRSALSWPLAEDLRDEALERLLFPPLPSDRLTRPDYRLELQGESMGKLQAQKAAGAALDQDKGK